MLEDSKPPDSVPKMAILPSPRATETGPHCSPSPAPDATLPHRGLIELTVSDGIADLPLRREDARNAISPALLAELDRALSAIEEADNVKLLVLRAEGTSFSAGVDLAAIEALPPEEARAFFERGRILVRRLEGLGVVTLAAVNGLALGGG